MIVLLSACSMLAPVAPPAPAAGFESAPGGVFTDHAPGTRLYVGDFGVPLYTAADAASERVATLRFGKSVEVIRAVGDAVELEGRTHRWFEVRSGPKTGFVFGAELSPIAGERDSEIQTHDVWVVTFDENHRPVLRMQVTRTDGEGAPPPAELETVLTPTERFVGGSVVAAPSTWGMTTAVDVTLCDREPRTDGPRCSTSTAAVALERDFGMRLAELTPPDAWKWSLDRSRVLDCAEPGVVPAKAWETPKPRVAFPMESIVRGPDSEVVCRAVGEVTEGEHAGHPVITCLEVDSFRATLTVARFIEVEKDRWAELSCHSDVKRDVAEALPRQRIHVVDAGPVQLGGVFAPPPDVIWESADGQLVPDGLRVGTLEDPTVLFEHDTLGAVVRAQVDDGSFMSSRHTVLALARPEGGYLSLTWRPSELAIAWDAGHERLAATTWSPRGYQTPGRGFTKAGRAGERTVYVGPSERFLGGLADRGPATVAIDDPWGNLWLLDPGEPL